MRVWFDDPFSALHILSWIALIISLLLAISGFRELGFKDALGDLESGELKESGIYSSMRHPLYSSLLFLAFGAFLKGPSLFTSILMVGVIVTLMSTVRSEEEANLLKFGDKYDAYMKRTKMLVPFIF